MKDANLYDKLTPAARQALEELVEEYKSEILRRASDSAASLTGEVREVSVHDIFQGVGEFQKRGVARYRTPMERVLNLYMVTGVVLGAVGLLYYVFRTLMGGLETRDQLPLLFSFAGFTIAAMSFAVLWLRQARERREFARKVFGPADYGDIASVFISRWRELELTLRNVVAADFGESLAKEPVSILVRSLVKKGRLSDQDMERIRRLLETRNRLVHKGDLGRRDEMNTAMGDLERLLHKLGTHAA